MTGAESSDKAGIEERLDRIVHLLTALVTKDLSRKDSVLTLTAAGLAPKEIASILGLSGNQVSVVLYDTRHAAVKEAKSTKKASVKRG
jgi:DNA-binding CsgD family transcriptional regulator